MNIKTTILKPPTENVIKKFEKYTVEYQKPISVIKSAKIVEKFLFSIDIQTNSILILDKIIDLKMMHNGVKYVFPQCEIIMKANIALITKLRQESHVL